MMSQTINPSVRGAPALSPSAGALAMGALALYGVFFALAPALARAFPFEAAFYEGQKPAILTEPQVDQALNFYCAVIGGVMAGWFATLALLMRDPRRAVWNAALGGAAIWFAIDSLGSILTGYWQNAVINAGFGAVIVGILLASRPVD
ncbi:hypothetical protein [Parvularcula lutaonensis]|uniref:DUF1761 domain-containing protein n=1 Tax=Parvularcula lutaonensis TaxID=491923 RepID=A0ABV7MCB3_9PROT|nr:hypothetical protein [Parvularcula lutaonensis]GGY50287.1 hypothetical protein GCM10007148_18840 [Parvularcula lutaonensis]